MKHHAFNSSCSPLAALLAGAALALVAGGSAQACDEATASASSGRMLYAFSASTGEDGQSQRIELSIVNGEINVTLNGEKVSADRLRKEDGRVVVLDEHGKEMSSIAVRQHGDVWGVGIGGEAMPLMERLRRIEGGQRAAVAGPPPKVMLGMLMSEPGPALEKQLRLEPGATTIVSGVHEGLPAQLAGLAEYDIITEVNGKKPADAATIRKVLADANPGDSMQFTVVSGGQTRSAAVKLEAYDAAKMQDAKVLGESRPADEVTAAMRAMEGAKGWTWTRRLSGDGDEDFLVTPNAGAFRVVQPQGDAAMKLKERAEQRIKEQGKVDQRLEQIDERIARLEKLLEAIAAQKKSQP